MVEGVDLLHMAGSDLDHAAFGGIARGAGDVATGDAVAAEDAAAVDDDVLVVAVVEGRGLNVAGGGNAVHGVLLREKGEGKGNDTECEVMIQKHAFFCRAAALRQCPGTGKYGM